MRITFFNTKPYDHEYFERFAPGFGHQLHLLDPALDAGTAHLAMGSAAVCVFVNDSVDAACLEQLREVGVHAVALRAAGHNNVDLTAAEALDMQVVNVPCYSPHAVAEHAVALCLALGRHLIEADKRVHAHNFALNGLLGSNLNGKTVGVVGTGRIGSVFSRIMLGFGCHVLAHDIAPDPECQKLGIEYTTLERVLPEADVISLHCPLNAENRHLIDDAALARMKSGAILINTARGGLIDTAAALEHLRSGHLGKLGLDVYENEAGLFFEDLSSQQISDPLLVELLSLPNVLITSHQAFFTEQAMEKIALTTLQNLTDIEAGRRCENQLSAGDP